jgi:isocitrate dehydrogenase
VRENEEDTYAGIEHRQSEQVMQCLKLITRPGCEKIVRYAFEYARANGRRKVTCMSKDNIMKRTDGLFHKVFDEIAPQYPDIENEHWIVDIGTAKLADTPELFDVVVTLNLYRDIISDMTAQVAGSVGLAGSANIGEKCAMFEAIHGSAPRRAGQNVANPSGLLHGAILMLIHIGQGDIAEKIHNAWLRTIEDGVHTYDIASEAHTTQQVGTQEFAQAVVERIGQRPEKLKAVSYKQTHEVKSSGPITTPLKTSKQEIVGCDLFVQRSGITAEDMSAFMGGFNGDGLKLNLLSNRGVKVWPGGSEATGLIDHWRCRYYSEGPVEQRAVLNLLRRATDGGAYWNHVELLQNFDGERAYSLAQGE